MRQVYSREKVRRLGEEKIHWIQEMYKWLGTPGSGDVTRDEFERLKGYVLRVASERYERPTRYMRYFTRPEVALSPHEWAEDEQHRQYRVRLDQIADLLPPPLLTYAREVSLHDGRFRWFDVDETTKTINVQVEVPEPMPREALDWDDVKVGAMTEDRMLRIGLHYGSAQVVSGITDELANVVNAPDTEVLSEEVDLVDDSVFEHRLLLWPEGDLAIRFSEFSFTREEIAGQVAG